MLFVELILCGAEVGGTSDPFDELFSTFDRPGGWAVGRASAQHPENHEAGCGGFSHHKDTGELSIYGSGKGTSTEKRAWVHVY